MELSVYDFSETATDALCDEVIVSGRAYAGDLAWFVEAFALQERRNDDLHHYHG